jgi:hypothetical protein
MFGSTYITLGRKGARRFIPPDYGVIANHAKLNPAELTIEVWFRFQPPPYYLTFPVLIQKYELGGSYPGYDVGINAYYLENTFSVWCGGAQRIYGTTIVTDGAVHQGVATIGPTVQTIYVDGIYNATYNLVPNMTSASDLYLGRRSDGVGISQYSGDLLSVKLLGRVKSAIEVKRTFERELSWMK